MKTMRPDLNSRRSQPSLLDIKLGSVVEIDNDHGFISRYILVGMSLTGYALISLHDDIEICNFLSANTSLPSYPLTINSNNISINTYADCSKVIICPFGIISDLIKGKASAYIGQLDTDNTEEIVKLIKNVDTITPAIKNEYFI